MNNIEELEAQIETAYYEIRDLENKINNVKSSIAHELYGHILENDEETWNKEFYTNGKLDYRKLLIHLLRDDVLEPLGYDFTKSWMKQDYEN